MTFQELYEELQEYLGNRTDLTDAKAQDAINRAYLRICDSFNFYGTDDTDTTITTSDGTASYTRPTDIDEIISVKITGDTEYTLDLRTIDWYERQDTSSDNTGVPEVCVPYGANLLFWPTPDDTYSIRIRGKSVPTEMSSDSDEPVIPTKWHEAIILSAASRECFKRGMIERGQDLKNEYLGLISGLQEEKTKDARHRVGQISVQRTRRSNRAGYPDPNYAETP